MNKLTEEETRALYEASEILSTEANILASYLQKTLKVELDPRDEIISNGPLTPHRVSIAVRNEMERLRAISYSLKGISNAQP